jgi:uncharacterized protein YeaO (DUF488 family)
VEFEEFEAYLVYLADSGVEASTIAGLPRTEAEFDAWWQRISVSDDLRFRWTKRIRLREQFLNDLADEIDAMKRAA